MGNNLHYSAVHTLLVLIIFIISKLLVYFATTFPYTYASYMKSIYKRNDDHTPCNESICLCTGPIYSYIPYVYCLTETDCLIKSFHNLSLAVQA